MAHHRSPVTRPAARLHLALRRAEPAADGTVATPPRVLRLWFSEAPEVAALIQDRLGIRGAGAIELGATCAGFAYGIHVANGLVTSRLRRKVLVAAGETLSTVLDYSDRTTCILFGDGAGAAVVERDERRGRLFGFHVGSEGAGASHLYRTGLSSRIAPEGDVW